MKIERLLAIIVLLLNRRKITARELAGRFEVSVRTIYRDIATLNGAGIPVISSQGQAGGLAIPDGYKLSRQLLTARDLEAMLATLRGVNQALANKDLQRIIDTLDNLLPKNDESA
ncbi:MAG: HTH domain-containing protein, partial [Desulfofustis sp.]|nr:HTH domain-containing protein [Desulfofustis sp.]